MAEKYLRILGTTYRIEFQSSLLVWLRTASKELNPAEFQIRFLGFLDNFCVFLILYSFIQNH